MGIGIRYCDVYRLKNIGSIKNVKGSLLEEEFIGLLSRLGFREGVDYRRNVRFIEGRKFEGDFVFLRRRVSIEVQGGIWLEEGGHRFPTFLERDWEKANLAQLSGFIHLQFSGNQIRRRPFWVMEVVKAAYERAGLY